MINYTNLEEVLDKEGYVIKDFNGYSMYPTFLKDDLLVIIKTNTYNLYDIVLYKREDKYVAHRIIDIKDNFYIIRGDNTVNDEYIPKEQILGVISSIYRGKQEIKFDYKTNYFYYKKSLKSLSYRKLKYRVKKILKYE